MTRRAPSQIWIKDNYQFRQELHHWIQDLEPKEQKEQILANLTDWSFSPLGGLVHREGFINQTYKNVEDFRLCNYVYATLPIKQALYPHPKTNLTIKKALLSEIKKSPEDWKIEKEGENLEVLIHKSGWKHWKDIWLWDGMKDEVIDSDDVGLTNREWNIIKKILNHEDVDLEKIYPSDESSDKKTISQPSWWEQKKAGIFLIIIIIISLLFAYMFFKKRK